MPEMVESNSWQRFSALLEFQRDVDPTYPSHTGKKSADEVGYHALAGSKSSRHHRARHGDLWQSNWSDTLSAILLSSSMLSNGSTSSPVRSCGIEVARSFYPHTLTQSRGQFSPQKFMRSALKRAFSTDHSFTNAKRMRFDSYNSMVEPMVCVW
uniref:Uncharacterized protein n=1 Tax=Physcomitrium patens TaxID=3218 RepID=A0A2K1L763_PHYPA|nr:hypothetical protein PHYPA_000255 [Physcomitrium patens]